MQQAMFHPTGGSTETREDSWAKRLTQIAQGILVVVLGLLPILFIPSVAAPFGYSKVMLVVFGVTIALIFYSLAILREGVLTVRAPLGLLAMWALAGVTLLAALFSGDFSDAFIGIAFGTQTAAFVILLAFVASLMTIFRSSKVSVIRLYSLITISALILGLFHLVRFFAGPEFLSFGVFTSNVSTPVGGWNDVALFFGLALLLGMVAIEQLPLSKWGRIALVAVSVLSLVILAVVNFFAVWLVLGIVSLIMLMHGLTKHRFKQVHLEGVSAVPEGAGVIGVVLSIIVFIMSVFFVIGGSALGGLISDTVGFEYVQVSPSFNATLEIARSVYGENAFFGIGPDKFGDAWRLYKNESINPTVYWNTLFTDGSGYVTTSFVNTGLFGVVAWVLFFGFLCYSGIRMIFGAKQPDRFWYFIAVSSFVAAIYLWGMSVIYVPTATMLLLAAVCTGVMFTAYGALMPTRSFTLSVNHDNRAVFALVAAVIIIIVGSVSVLYFAGRHYAALYSFNNALVSISAGDSIEEVEQRVAGAYAISNDDLFAREVAGYQLAQLNALLNVTDPTEAQLQQFQQTAVNGINAAQLAVENDTTEPLNWLVLGQIYSVLSVAGIEGAYDRSKEAFTTAAQYDPKSPLYPLLEAQLEARNGNVEAAKAKAEEAVSLKRNYTDALILLAEIDIAEGNIEQAVSRTEALVSLEPNNPARLYQLGILYTAAENSDGAIAAFAAAVRLDNNYANARYLLALQLAERGEVELAIEQLQVVAELNPENGELGALIEVLQTEGSLPTSGSAPAQVSEDEVEVGEAGEVTATGDEETPLVTPVNTVPASDDAGATETDSTEDTEAVETPNEETTETSGEAG